MNFVSLESLRLLCAEILEAQGRSLKYFAFDHGYSHLRSREKRSVSSSATCALSLVATNHWPASPAETKDLLHYLIGKRRSAKLPWDNPFTTAWILEAVAALSPLSDAVENDDHTEIARKEGVLKDFILKSVEGGISMPVEGEDYPSQDPRGSKAEGDIKTKPEEPPAAEKNAVGTLPSAETVSPDIGSAYPPSAYLTQLVVRVLRKRKALPKDLSDKVSRWAWSELARQFALVQAGSKSQDPFSVAYLVILVSALTPKSTISPEQSAIRKAALASFFSCQLGDGTWPLSRPLFHYPKFGNAYCYEYEMLTQLLEERELQDLLLDYLPKLELALRSSTVTNVYRLDDGVWAWSSGHHPQLRSPESWATASVFHFAHAFDVLLAEAVRREVFRYVDLPRPTASFELSNDKFADDVLDSMVTLRGQPDSLREHLWMEFVEPISKEAPGIVAGAAFKKNTPRSAIFYGPPGTSKTDLSRKIASFLGWPFLALDPSVLLRHGMDGIQAEANTIFRMLEQTDAVVVLFDEFDELVRERGAKAEQPFSRLLTTSMLPKLARLHKRGTLVFLIATNNISEFDLAISRRGRFDKVFQVMPPTLKEKLAFKKWGPDKKIDINGIFEKLQVAVDDDVKRMLGELTFDETDALAAQLGKAETPQEAIKVLTQQWKDSTMQKKVPKTQSSREEEITWADRCRAESSLSH